MHQLTTQGQIWLEQESFPHIQQQPDEGQQAEMGSEGFSTGDPRRPLQGPETEIQKTQDLPEVSAAP